MSKPTVIFRADGHAKMGLGHLVRSSALAEMLREEFSCHLVYHSCPESLLTQFKAIFVTSEVAMSEAGTVADAHETISYGASLAAPGEKVIFVTDGYQFRTEYQRAIKAAGHYLLCIDDIHAFPFAADIVINHAPGVAEFYHGLIPQGTLRSGLDYALLRAPFLTRTDNRPHKDHFDNIFICFGGSDFHGLSVTATAAVLEAGYSVDLVVGAAFAREAELTSLTGAGKGLRIHRNLSASRMAELMQNSDAAIVPASSILYEVCSLHIPAISGYYVDNQERIYEGFVAEGLILGVGDFRRGVNYAAVLQELALNRKTLLLRQSEKFSGRSKERYVELFKLMLR